MANENTAETILKYTVDAPSIQKAVLANTQVSESYKRLNAEVNKISAGGGGGVLRYDTAQQAAAALGISVSQIAGTEAAITAEMTRRLPISERLAEAAKVRASAGNTEVAALRTAAFSDSTRAVGGVSAGSRISGASRALFNLPDVQLAGGVSTTVISRLGLLAGGAADSLGLTATQLGAIALVGGGVALALKGVADQFAETREKALAFANAQARIATLVASGGTREDLIGRRDQAESERQGFLNTAQRGKDALAEYEEAINALNASLNTIGFTTTEAERAPLVQRARDAEEALRELFGVVPSDMGGMIGLNDAIAEQEKNAEQAASAVASANLALANNETAAADLAVALEKLSEAQLNEIQRRLEIDNLTTEQREERIRANEREINVLTRIIGEGELSADALSEVADQITQLTTDTELLTSVNESYADQLEAERIAKENLTAINDQILDMIDQEIAAREDYAEVQAKIAAIEAKRIADITEVLAESEERIKEIGEDNAEARIKIEEDAARRIAQINLQAKRATEQAIGDRDVRAFTQAKERQGDALDQENESYKLRLKDLDKALEKQFETEQRAREKQLRSITQAANERIATEQATASKLLNIIQTSAVSQEFLAASTSTKVLNAQGEMYNAMVYTAYDYGVRINAALMAGLGGRVGSGGGGGGGSAGGKPIGDPTKTIRNAFRIARSRAA